MEDENVDDEGGMREEFQLCKPWWLGFAHLVCFIVYSYVYEWSGKPVKRKLTSLMYLYFAVELIFMAFKWEMSNFLTAVLVQKSSVSAIMAIELLSKREWRHLKKKYGVHSYAYGALYILYSTVGIVFLVLIVAGALHAIWLPALVGTLCLVFVGKTLKGDSYMSIISLLCISIDIAGVAGWHAIHSEGWGLNAFLKALPGWGGVEMVRAGCFC